MAVLDASEQQGSERQARASWLFIVTVVFLILFALFVTYRFILPDASQNFVSVGSLDEFPPSPSPYEIKGESIVVHVVNMDGELVVFNPETPHHRRCNVVWQEGNQRFADPCNGSKFSLDGHYIEGPASRGLDMYPFYVNDEQEIMVDTAQIMLGRSIYPSPDPECVRALQEADLSKRDQCRELTFLPQGLHIVPHVGN